MTVLELRKQAVTAAKSFIGRKESDGSHKEIIDLYNKINPLPRGYKMKYTDPWCAAFVSVVSYVCNFLIVMPAECSCDKMIDLYKKMGRWIEEDDYKPEIGDVIFYDWDDSGSGDNKGSSDHVGIISSINGNKMTVIEGNMSDAVGTRSINVNARYIRGYGIPGYVIYSDENPEIIVDDGSDEVVIEPISKIMHSISLPELCYGDGLGNPDPVVEAAQILLIGNNFPCGSAGADGEFGNGTKAGVENFQFAKGLKVNGVINEETWLRLHGLK